MRATLDQIRPADSGHARGPAEPCPRPATARALPDQPGGAGAVGERPARRRCRPESQRGPGQRPRVRGRDGRARGQSRHARAVAPGSEPARGRRGGRTRPAMAAGPRQGRAERPAPRLCQAAARPPAGPGARQWRRGRDTGRHHRCPGAGTGGRQRGRAHGWPGSRHRRRARGHARQWQPSDGPGYRRRLRCLGPGRGLPRGRAGRLAGGGGGAAGHGRRRRGRRRARPRAGQLRRRAAGCALPSWTRPPWWRAGWSNEPGARPARLRRAGPGALPRP